MTKERHKSAAGRPYSASSPSSARPDSLASLGGGGASPAGASSSQKTAAASSSSHSAPRSRKKLKHRSSLEFLDGGFGSDSAVGSAKDGSSKRKRKMTPVSPSASANTSSAVKRQISPQSKSKLVSLAKQTEPSDQATGVKKKRLHDSGSLSGSKSEKKSAVSDEKRPSSTAVRSDKKSVVKHIPKNSKRIKQQSAPKSIMESSSKWEAKMKDQFTPKMNRVNNNKQTQQKETPEVSYSPLDYRLESNSAVTKNVKGGADTPGLETYVEQWTRPSPDKTHQDATTMMKQETKGGKVNDKPNHEEGGDSQELLDDLSSSVVSTSSNSENDDDEEGGGGYYDGTMVKSNQSSEPQLNLKSNFMIPPSAPLQLNNENLQTEYGELAFMKQELERKMQLHKYDAKKCNPWSSGHPPSVTSSDGLLKAGVAGSSKDKQLRLSNHDNLASASKNSPPREAVAYGEMIFQRTMEEQNKGVSWPGKHEEQRAPSSNPQNVRDERRRYHEGDSYKRHQEVNHHGDDDRYDQRESSTKRYPPSKPKPKKKRKRRVVETITRVIHEESEEEGSASTRSGGKRSRDYQYSQHRSPPSRDPRVSDSASYRRDGYSPSRSNPSQRPQYYTKRSAYSQDRESHRAPLRHRGEYDEYGDHSDRDSSVSEGRNGHHLSYEGKRGSPQKNSKSPNSPGKKRSKSSQQSPSRGRSHTNQHSMLESL